jgi:hypothetical protein
MALAATDGSLLDRVRRILGQPAHGGRVPNGWAPAVLMVLAAGALVPGAVGLHDLQAQPGLIAGGVQAPAESGVVSGVPGGVASGVPGGVASGVPGGIPSGVPGGVPAGVPGGIAESAPGVDQQSSGEEFRRMAKEYEALIARFEEMQAKRTPEQEVQTQKILELLKAELAAREDWVMRQLRLEQERARLKFDQVESAQAGLEKDLEIRISILRKQIEDNKRRVEVGIVPKDVVEKMEAELQSALAQREAAGRDRTMARQQLALEHREVEERSQFELKQLQLELAKQELLAREMGSRALLEKLSEMANQEVQVDAERRAEAARQLNRAAQEYTAMAELERTVDQNRDVRAGDLLRIEISGEPGLPVRYEVSADGTIRIPFLGLMKVAGRTPAQIQEQLQRALTERKLAERAEVAVRIVR